MKDAEGTQLVMRYGNQEEAPDCSAMVALKHVIVGSTQDLILESFSCSMLTMLLLIVFHICFILSIPTYDLTQKLDK